MFICDETTLFAACVRSSWSSDKNSDSNGSIHQWRAFGPFEKHPLGSVQEVLKGFLSPFYQRATAFHAHGYPLGDMQAQVLNPCERWLLIYLWAPWHCCPK